MAPTPSKNGPCPCGSGKKYKKCCLERDQKDTPRDPARPLTMAEKLKVVREEERETERLMELSNHANDLNRAEDWEAAYAACTRLLEQFPGAIDGHMRFEDYYYRRGDYIRSREHVLGMLQLIRQDPDMIGEGLIEDYTDHLQELERRIADADT